MEGASSRTGVAHGFPTHSSLNAGRSGGLGDRQAFTRFILHERLNIRTNFGAGLRIDILIGEICKLVPS
jgi:hypothetical protein